MVPAFIRSAGVLINKPNQKQRQAKGGVFHFTLYPGPHFTQVLLYGAVLYPFRAKLNIKRGCYYHKHKRGSPPEDGGGGGYWKLGGASWKWVNPG